MRRLVLSAVLAVVVGSAASPARGGTRVLMPRVSYRRVVQSSAHGPVVLHVITAPRPGGLYQLKPLLSSGTILGRERATSMERSISRTATVAGVNGDLFNWKDGHPTGIVLDDGVLKSSPYRWRSSTGVTAGGRLEVARVGLYGIWQGLEQPHPPPGLNHLPPADRASIFTPAYGPETPELPGAAAEAVVEPFPAAVPGQELAGTVTGQAA